MSALADSQQVLASVKLLPTDWHRNGTVDNRVLDAIARYAGSGEVVNSIETGTGRTTLLLSHLSKRHTVFALGDDDSIRKVRACELLNRSTTSFIEGPSQRTVPLFDFPRLQLALLDGPHAYPFPELEYYFVYPHLDENALLIIDDINIPTIRRMFEVLNEDDMYETLETIAQTAFLRRTSIPALDPYGDNWWEQRFNSARARRRPPSLKSRLYGLAPSPIKKLFSFAARSIRPKV